MREKEESEEGDTIVAFFPCTRFEAYVPLHARAEMVQAKKWDLEKKLEYSRKIFGEINYMYQLWTKMWLICARGGQALICENPYVQPHILSQFFPVKPKVIHTDRTLYGDYYKKPTQYWFLNCDPKQNFLFENLQTCDGKIKRIDTVRGSKQSIKTERSMISPVYANRFIRENIMAMEAMEDDRNRID